METKNGIEIVKPGERLSLPPYGIMIRSHHHGPKFGTAEHEHPYHSLLYIVGGEGKCLVGGKSYEVRANTAVILAKGRRHQLIDEAGKAMVVFVVYFSDTVTNANKDVFHPLVESGGVIRVPVRQGEQIRSWLRQMLHEQNHKPEKFETAIRQCLMFIALQIYRASLTRDKGDDQLDEASVSRVRKVLEYVAERYYEPYSLSEAAAMAHLSQRQLTNLCRKLTKKSFVEYVNAVRVERARQLITTSDVPVLAIAFEVGFEEMSTFYRAFKKHFKVAPLSFRA